MKPNLLAPVIPFWIKQRPSPIDEPPVAKPQMDASQSPEAFVPTDEVPLFDAAPDETDMVSAGLDAADIGLRKVQQSVSAILGKVNAAINDPERRDELAVDVGLLKERVRAEVEDAQRDGMNWLTLDFGQDPQEKMLPRPTGDEEDPAGISPVVLISSGDAADGILTRPYGASEEQERGGFHLLSDDAAFGQDLSREIAISSESSGEDLKDMRAALSSITADLAKAGARLDQARAPSEKPSEQTSATGQSTAISAEIDTLLASVTRDALRAQALNIMNGDSSGLKRLLAG
ncbi:hypothetical protein M2360_002399 [Rhizobium sp. SG_E_25_P2]|uniref:hypothetical protein n=1 Tax=Rhizobium sp. SG_E_25_P2 TaxID=2879942 RepID=UPI002473E5D5|nr:hypothetical protein [Rhizobium sp. SG_E_25_P2]MDH6267002.1 hypothetical protein [Rhizobium sp. SG_E_25_P2]